MKRVMVNIGVHVTYVEVPSTGEIMKIENKLTNSGERYINLIGGHFTEAGEGMKRRYESNVDRQRELGDEMRELIGWGWRWQRPRPDEWEEWRTAEMREQEGGQRTLAWTIEGTPKKMRREEETGGTPTEEQGVQQGEKRKLEKGQEEGGSQADKTAEGEEVWQRRLRGNERRRLQWGMTTGDGKNGAPESTM